MSPYKSLSPRRKRERAGGPNRSRARRAQHHLRVGRVAIVNGHYHLVVYFMTYWSTATNIAAIKPIYSCADSFECEFGLVLARRIAPSFRYHGCGMSSHFTTANLLLTFLSHLILASTRWSGLRWKVVSLDGRRRAANFRWSITLQPHISFLVFIC
jgi:hypothetical protein